MEEIEGDKKDIVPLEGRGLTKYSSALIRRGLDLASNVEKQSISFIAHEHFKLGASYDYFGIHGEAEKEYLSAIELDPLKSEAHLALGKLYSDIRIEDAEREHREAVRLNPENADFHSGLASFLEKQSRFDEAEKEYREAIRLAIEGKYEVSINKYFLGNLLFKKGKYKDVERELRDTVKDIKGLYEQEAYELLGNSLLCQGKYEDAEQVYFHNYLQIYYEGFIPHEDEYNPHPSWEFEHIYEIGYELLSHGRLKEAEEKFREGANIRPYFEEVYNGFKPLFQKRGRPDAVPEYFAKLYAQSSKRHSDALRENSGQKNPLGLGRDLLNQQDFKGAEKEIRKYITSLEQIKEAEEKLKWRLIRSLVLLAYSLDKQGKRAEARQYWVKAERMIPEVLKYYQFLGEYKIVYKRLSEPD